MKTKNSKHQHVSVHMRIERMFRHHSFLTFTLSVMAIGLIKYQTHALHIVQELYYGHGVGMVSSYTHHQETTRMPVTYGSSVRIAPISGE